MASCMKLFAHLVRPFARGVLARFDLFPSLTAQDTDEAPHRVRLPVAFMISGSVARLVRFIVAITSAFILVRSAFGWPAGFLVAFLAFFAGFVDLQPALGLTISGAILPVFALACVFVHWVSP